MKKPQGAPAKKAEPTPVVAPPPSIPAALPDSRSQGRRHRQRHHLRRGDVGQRNRRRRLRQRAGRRRHAIIRASRRRGGSPRFPTRRISPPRLDRHSERQRRRDASGSTRRQRRPTAASRAQRRSLRRRADVPADRSVTSRFRPARDPTGRPVAQDVTFFPNWRRADQRVAAATFRCCGRSCRQLRLVAAVDVVVISDRLPVRHRRSDR